MKIWIKPVNVSTHGKEEAFIPIILNLKKYPTSKFRRMFRERI